MTLMIETSRQRLSLRVRVRVRKVERLRDERDLEIESLRVKERDERRVGEIEE